MVTARGGQDLTRTIPIGEIGGLDLHRQRQATRIDQQMTLAAVQFLGPVPAARPPFSVVFALWLSKIAALGAGDRPARARVATRS